MKKIIRIAAILVMTSVMAGCSDSKDTVSDNVSDSTEYNEGQSILETTQNSDGSYTKEVFAMDTYMTLSASGDAAQEALDAAAEEIIRLDNLFSTNIASSDIAKVNEEGGGTVSEETAYLIEKSIEFYNQTNGVYDITIYPLVREWGFTTEEYHVPSDDTISKLMNLVGTDMMHLDEESYEVTFDKEGMMIDLGTIAKGYTSQKIMDIFKEYGLSSGLVSLGGNVQVLGTKEDGSRWKIAIQNPDNDLDGSEDFLGVVEVEDVAVTTAGGYERYFEQDGVIYRHIFDTSTGCPTTSSLKSVTVIAQDGTDADGYDTPLFIMDKDGAIEFYKEHADQFEMILMDEDDVVYVTEGISDYFTSDYETQIISK